MNVQTLDSDVIDRPVIDSWRREPTREQIAYATDLCRSELPYADRVRTINSFPALDSSAMSELISRLTDVRAARLRRLRNRRRR